MENKQNDRPNQEETDEQLNQPVVEQEKTKKEINPNNPSANQNKQDGSIQKNKHPQDKTSISILNTHDQVEDISTPLEMTEKENEEGNTQERENEIREEAIIDGIHGVTKSIKFPRKESTKKTEGKTDNLYIKKGDL